MAILKTYWNFVDCAHYADLRMFARSTAIVNQKAIASGCRGVLFRSVVSEELDASNLINELRFEDIRRARAEPDNTLLFRPKCADEKSIGVLRIIKPRRFVSMARVNIDDSAVSLDRVGSKDFDVLLETTEFILENAQEQMAERFQLQETFSNFTVNFFGKRPEIFSYSGSLLNANGNLQWRNQFLDNYEKFLRGSKCAELGARAYFLYDDVMREGYILSASTDQNSVVEGVVKFNFVLLVTAKRIMGVVPVSRSGTLTLDRKGDLKSGITDFQFFRSIDPDLPSVTSAADAEQFAEGGEVSLGAVPEQFSFVENRTLPNDDPPDDLKQQMMNRGLQALAKVGQGSVEISDSAIDHDILLDFIGAKSLGSNTSLIISGAKTLDVDNFSGDQLVLLLLDDKIAVNDLKFKQAVAVADSFARTNKARVSDKTALALGELARFFSANADQRVPNRVTAQAQSVLAAPKQYVLESGLDNATIASVITTTEPFRVFDEAAVKAEIVGKANFGLMRELRSDKSDVLKLMQYYISAFMVIKNPATGNLFPEVSSVLHADPSGQANLIAYLDTLTINDVAAFVTAMSQTASIALNSALDNIAGSTFFTALATDLGIQKQFITLSDGTLISAVNPVTSAPSVGSFNYGKYIYAVGALICAMAGEASSSDVPATADVVGGTIKSTTDPAQYFVPEADSELIPDANQDSVALLSFGPVNPTLYLSGGHLIIPFFNGLYSDVFAVIPGVVFGNNTITLTLDPSRKKYNDVGYIKLTPAQYSQLSAASKVTFFFRAAKRKTAVYIKDQTSLTTPQAIGINPDNIPFPSDQKNSFFNLSKIPIQQAHFGGNSIRYSTATCDSIRSLFSNIQSKIFVAANDIPKGVLDFITDSLKNTPSDESLKKSLSLDKFIGIPSVAQLKTALDTIGVTTDVVTELVIYSKAEVDMAKKMVTLRDTILTAKSEATNDPEGRAAAVAKSNQSMSDAVCA